MILLSAPMKLNKIFSVDIQLRFDENVRVSHRKRYIISHWYKIMMMSSLVEWHIILSLYVVCHYLVSGADDIRLDRKTK